MNLAEASVIDREGEGMVNKEYKYRYKIGILVRCMEWPEVVYANDLPEAISKVTAKLLKDEPNLKSWKTRLISELYLPTMKYLRRGDGKFD